MIHKIKSGIFNILRQYVKNYITGNLGKVEEDDGYLICYIDKRKIKKKKIHHFIHCPGIREKDKELAKAYKLYKKIYYVFEDLEFNNSYVTIFGYGSDSEIIIKKCKIKYGFDIKALGKCTVDNCLINSNYKLNLHAKNLTLKNMNINNAFILSGCDFQVSFSADENLIIENCTIGRINDKTKVFLTSLQNINLINSKIVADTIKCSTKALSTYNSSLFKAKEKIEIDGEILSSLTMISPVIKVNDEFTDKRIKLINTLKNIRDKCIKINQQKVKKYENNLNSISLKRVLKK